MIDIKATGDYRKTFDFLRKATRLSDITTTVLSADSQSLISNLSIQTPVDDGLTARSWFANVSNRSGKTRFTIGNSNLTSSGVPIPILLMYGHRTRSGYFIEGRDFVNPTLNIFVEEAMRRIKAEVK